MLPSPAAAPVSLRDGRPSKVQDHDIFDHIHPGAGFHAFERIPT